LGFFDILMTIPGAPRRAATPARDRCLPSMPFHLRDLQRGRLCGTGASNGFRRQMHMKTFLIILGMLVVAGSAFAVILLPFTSWDDLSSKSPDIIIARCANTPEPMIVNDGMIWSDIEVISVLKGDTKPGTARMVSQYGPCQGERFLLFSTYQSNELYRAYNATETYRVVPLGRLFQTNELSGKTLDAKIQLVLQHRLEELKRELEQGEVEKKRLEQGLGQ
jgi:hypothetical protein